MFKWQTDFKKYLKLYYPYLTKQQFRTLKGQAMSGDKKACRKGLTTILKRKGIEVNLGRW